VSEQHHQRLVRRIFQVDRSVRFGQPQLDAAGGQRGGDLSELVAVEGPFVLADHYRVERAVGTRGGGQEGGGLGTFGPGQPAGAADIEEFFKDAASTGDRLSGRVELPGPGRCSVLVLAGGDPTVECKPGRTRDGRYPNGGGLSGGTA